MVKKRWGRVLCVNLHADGSHELDSVVFLELKYEFWWKKSNPYLYTEGQRDMTYSQLKILHYCKNNLKNKNALKNKTLMDSDVNFFLSLSRSDTNSAMGINLN